MGAGGSTQEIRVQSGVYKTRRVQELPKNKLPHEVLDGFTNYMKTEIETSQERQKKHRQATVKQIQKQTNPPVQHAPHLIEEPPKKEAVRTVESVARTKTPEEVPTKARDPSPIHQEAKKTEHEELKAEEPVVKGEVLSFKVETEEKELEMYRNPESPRPAPPVFDELIEAETIYNKQERIAKEKEAVELAQKAAHDQKMIVEKEIGEKKNELDQLENKYENIAAKYMNKK